MNQTIDQFLPRLGILVPAGIAIWAVACFLLNGPAILAYIGLQAGTAGFFAFAMHRMERVGKKRQNKKLALESVSARS